ncbi:hypothetical protein CBL_10463 [Carabus blaptoides fortunei]
MIGTCNVVMRTSVQAPRYNLFAHNSTVGGLGQTFNNKDANKTVQRRNLTGNVRSKDGWMEEEKIAAVIVRRMIVGTLWTNHLTLVLFAIIIVYECAASCAVKGPCGRTLSENFVLHRIFLYYSSSLLLLSPPLTAAQAQMRKECTQLHSGRFCVRFLQLRLLEG